MRPQAKRLVTAAVALTTQPMGAAPNTKNRTSRSRAKAFGLERKRRASPAPATACRAAPAPMESARPRDLTWDPKLEGSYDVPTFTRNEPRTTPGHTREPRSRAAAKAMPALGHTAVAYPGGIARRRASLPARKYAAAMPRHSAARRFQDGCGGVVTAGRLRAGRVILLAGPTPLQP